MSVDKTLVQGDDEWRRGRRLSLKQARPPIELENYDAKQFLGSGAFGEVWVAIDRNTGRRVAIKFYTRRSGIDWSQLSREVEKLVVLSADRCVVQLLDVGWDADPPYYVMEYLERGSLDDRIRAHGTLPAAESLTLFREVAVGLVHAHGKGVLHCDLKPGNVLLDQDDKPRLADFGQSRLSHEQAPALGTLFYMAPEQADLKAFPDARWDVYALGALLYTMLTGAPPHCNDDAVTEIESAPNLEQRLTRYRRHLESRPPPTDHRRVPGVDRSLAEIIDRSLEVDPSHRYPNVEAVLAAIDHREARRARLPLVVLGMIGPALLMLVVSIAAWWAVTTIVRQTDGELTRRSLQNNAFAARYVARTAASELHGHLRAVEQVAADGTLQAQMMRALGDAELAGIREKLDDPQFNPSDASDQDVTADVRAAREALRRHPTCKDLQRSLDTLFDREDLPRVASWFVDDPRGLQLARSPCKETIGRNYAWRNYFHGDGEDKPHDWRPGPNDHSGETMLSAMFRSQATGRWIAAVSTPIHGPEGKCLGIVALTVEVGRFMQLPGSEDIQAVLIDSRAGANQGLILQHPLFDQLRQRGERLPDSFSRYRVATEELLADKVSNAADYRDPLANDPRGISLQGRWLASTSPVQIDNRPSGLVVLVQERYDYAIGPALAGLRRSLWMIGTLAVGAVAVVILSQWAFVARLLVRPRSHQNTDPPQSAAMAPTETMLHQTEPDSWTR
ncbi:MAG: serine/threonine protein kinase [Pirellulales bacterium]